MTGKFSIIDLKDIVVPENIINDFSDKRLALISNVFGTESEMLFFVIVTQKDSKYFLADRCDVYAAAKKQNIKKIRAFVIPNSNDLGAHITLSVKLFQNPVTLIRVIRPFVQKFGISETLSMFFLDSQFKRYYEISLSDDILYEFESLIHYVYSLGANTAVPLHLFEELGRTDTVEDQKKILKFIRTLATANPSRFRFPHNDQIRSASIARPRKEKQHHEKAVSDIREFECQNCHAKLIATPDYVGPRKDIDGITVVTGPNLAEHVFTIPQKYCKYLGVSKESPPIILSSQNNDFDTLAKKLSGKNFIVFVGKSTSNTNVI